ncbi:MAG TPA: sugar phosphate isomerase/epimerase [Planctomycetaceae bacterium]|nr:sugar phosphate isomerase/epimerase [Planctomycetaceae bacterium]
MPSENVSFDRRQFLQTGVAGATALLFAGQSAFAADDPYQGMKMGLQSYTLRNFKVEKALEITKELGLHYWEAFPGHLPMTTVPKQVAEEKDLLKGADVTLLAYGVLGFSANETDARSKFDYAKAMGFETLSADPKKDKGTFDLLDKLCEEYKINIAIHNHGPGAMYDKIDDVVNMVKDRNPRIGACVDTGHYLRSKENPVEALERLKGRVFGVHLKDVKDAKIFTILGEGDLDIVGCLKVLKRDNYKYSLALEYEENPANPQSDIEACLRNVRKAFEKI